MTRILFVDDDPLVLKGLERMLASQSHGWTCRFVDNGAKALEILASEPHDVIVSDLRMSRMTGAELLQEVAKKHPQMIRLILSSETNPEQVLRCAGVAHQCLAKPVNPESLVRTIGHAANMGTSRRNETVRELVARMGRLPTMPSLYRELVKRLDAPQTTLDEIADVVERDPGMTAQILRLVNSAFFGLGRKIASPFDAIGFLGVETIKSLVLSLHIFDQYADARIGGVSIDELWRHSVAVAGKARLIGQAERLRLMESNEAFAAGLLHDIGQIVLACNYPKEYAAARRLADEGTHLLPEVEQQVFGCNHADVGGYLLGLWGLPAPVVEATALHHLPSESYDHLFGPLTALHGANVLEHEELEGRTGTLRNWDKAYLTRLNLAGRVDEWREVCKVENKAAFAA